LTNWAGHKSHPHFWLISHMRHSIKCCLDVNVVHNLFLLQTKGYTNEHQGDTQKNDIMLRADNQ
jgi:hypothetical protein